MDITSLARQMSKHNVLIIGEDFKVQIGQHDGRKYYFHKLTNIYSNMIKDELLENKPLCLNTHS